MVSLCKANLKATVSLCKANLKATACHHKANLKATACNHKVTGNQCKASNLVKSKAMDSPCKEDGAPLNNQVSSLLPPSEASRLRFTKTEQTIVKTT